MLVYQYALIFDCIKNSWVWKLMRSNFTILIIFSMTDEHSGNVPRRFVGNEPKENEKWTIVPYERPTFWERSQNVRWERTKREQKTNQSHMRDQRSGNVPRRFVGNEPRENEKRTSHIWETNVLGAFPERSPTVRWKRTMREPKTNVRRTFCVSWGPSYIDWWIKCDYKEIAISGK